MRDIASIKERLKKTSYISFELVYTRVHAHKETRQTRVHTYTHIHRDNESAYAHTETRDRQAQRKCTHMPNNKPTFCELR